MGFRRALSSGTWRRCRTSTRSTATASSTGTRPLPGLFGLPGLTRPSDFPVLADRAIARCNAIRAKLAAQPDEDVGLPTLALLDAISNEICSVIDVAELVRNSHGDEGFRNQAEEVFAAMSSYIFQINKDKTLYVALMRVRDGGAQMAGGGGDVGGMGDEQRLLIEDLKREFEVGFRGGGERLWGRGRGSGSGRGGMGVVNIRSLKPTHTHTRARRRTAFTSTPRRWRGPQPCRRRCDTYTRIHAYTYIHMYTRIHTHTHAYTYAYIHEP